jgi:small subunit ribosomal protein S17
VETPEENNATT